MTSTTVQDLLPNLVQELERLNAFPLEVAPTNDFTVIEVFDNQERVLIPVEVGINWIEHLKDLPDRAGFERCWQCLVNLKAWEDLQDP